MEISDFTFTTLSPGIDLTLFDCGDEDLNDFLLNDSILYQDQRIGNTYLFVDADCIAAYFTISNDCLNDKGESRGYDNRVWNRFHRKTGMPNTKCMRQYPAVKIGRIGIHRKFQGHGLGHQLLDFIKAWTTIDHKPALRLLLLDAYNQPKQLAFYQKNDFFFLLEDDLTSRTRLMYFDLSKLQ